MAHPVWLPEKFAERPPFEGLAPMAQYSDPRIVAAAFVTEMIEFHVSPLPVTDVGAGAAVRVLTIQAKTGTLLEGVYAPVV